MSFCSDNGSCSFHALCITCLIYVWLIVPSYFGGLSQQRLKLPLERATLAVLFTCFQSLRQAKIITVSIFI